jgi:hypothetical protein
MWEDVMGSVHLIRIPDEKDRIRAIGPLSEVQITRVRLPGDIFGVTDEHIEALKKANIPFQYVSKEPANGQSSAAV